MKPYPDRIKSIIPREDRDFSDRMPIFISTSTNGFPTIETPDGIFKPDSEKELLTFLKTHHNFFTCCNQGELDSLFSFLTPDSLYELSTLGNCGVYRSYPSAISIKFGKSSHIVWNLEPFLNVTPNNLDQLDMLMTYLLKFYSENNIPLITLWSLGTVARNFFLSYPAIREEIRAVRQLPKQLLKHFHSSCLGQRHETDRLGSEEQFHYDMVKAHLNIIKTAPSKVGLKQPLKLAYPDAVYGSYLVKVTIPNKLKFSPTCVRNNNNTKNYYIHGPITSILQKPQLDSLVNQGLNVKILDSYELVGTPTYYTTFWAEDIKKILKSKASKILNLKFLYNSIAGNSISTFETVDKITGELYWEANQIYDPLLYGYTTGKVNSSILDLAYKLGENARALRADEISSSIPIKPIPEGFKAKLPGTTTYLNNLLKSLPDGSTLPWNDYIRQFRDKPYMEFPINHIVTIKSSPILGKRPGTLFESIKRIIPNHGCRVGTVPTKVGSLLDRIYPSTTSGVEEEYEEPTWMEYPQ